MKRALIVDDKEENLYYLRALLAGHGWTVDTAPHGAAALTLARRLPPDLVVSDLLMPVMDGYTLLRHWKVDVRLKPIPFIVYTATYTEAQDEQLAISLGADAFVLKPAEPEDFMARIESVMAVRGGANPGPVSVSPPTGDENTLLKVYSETLIRKLEEKTLQLEEANRVLQRDIAERSAAEERLRESEERFRATFEQAAVGIAHVGLDGAFLRVNAKLGEITGYSREELLCERLDTLMRPEDRAGLDAARSAMVQRTQAMNTSEQRFRRRDGGAFWGSLVTTLLSDEAGRPKYFICVLADVTERRELQEQFLRAQRMESIGTLAGGIAHDLNNLLAPITIGVELLKLGESRADRLQLIESMESSARRGANLVQQVLSFARGVEGARVVLHVGHVLREVESIICSSFPKNIRVQVEADRDLWLTTGDPTQLNQVFLNLAVNARDAMPSGGSLRFAARNLEVDAQYASTHRAAAAGRYICVEVTDNGTGLPPELLDRIFEPFFTTKEVGKGTGLGLSTVLGIVRSHGGFVTVNSQPGRGSCFAVHLPMRPENVGAVAVESVESGELPHGNGQLVLLVDDEASIRSITRQTLETFGYRVVTADDGAQAIGLYALHRTEIELVITDIMMPVMDGTALANALRRVNPAVRLLGISGRDSGPTAGRVASAGITRMLSKPFSAGALLRLMREVLEAPA